MPPRDFTSTPTLDPVEDLTRRRLLAAVPAFSLLAAGISCGDDDDDTGSDTWTYESEFGPVELPRTINRIVSVDFYSPAALIDIGRVPVGVVNTYFTDTEGGSIPLNYSQAVIDGGAGSIGEYWGFDIEAVAKADPDVIFATDDFLPLDADTREQLQQIAPIVTFTAHKSDSWVTRTDAIASILDVEKEMGQLKTEYERSRDDLRDRYPGLQDLSFAMFAQLESEWAIFPKEDSSNAVLNDLGVHFIEEDVTELHPDGSDTITWLSYEHLRLLDSADVILRVSDDATFAAIEGNPLWESPPAVQQGMVFKAIDRSAVGSYGWAMQNLEDLESLFAEIQARLDAR